MSMRGTGDCIEEALTVDCDGESLLGILSRPKAEALTSDLGILIIVGGPQYRAGSHRQFVLLARRLAAAGHACLRIDVRGMGDSSGASRSFEHTERDIACAIDALQRANPVLRGVVLWGLCDAASAALLYLDRHQDHRVSGLVLANPWVRTDQGLAKTHLKHYYRERLADLEFWRKLLRGQVAGKALLDLLQNFRLALGRPPHPSSATGGPSKPVPYQDRMARAWRQFNGPILLLLSERDHTAREFLEYSGSAYAWQGLAHASLVHRIDLPEMDHTFSSAKARDTVETHTLDWLNNLNNARHA